MSNTINRFSGGPIKKNQDKKNKNEHSKSCNDNEEDVAQQIFMRYLTSLVAMDAAKITARLADLTLQLSEYEMGFIELTDDEINAIQVELECRSNLLDKFTEVARQHLF